MTRLPQVSVLIPVYNARPFLREALESLAEQTFRDFEVVAIDDGSTDGSREVLTEAAKTWGWLHVIRQENGGMANALNRGLDCCRGEFLARMDADDRSRRDRFVRQVAVLRANPSIDAVGSAVRTFGDGATHKWCYPTTPEAVRARVFFASPFAHPALMFRRDSLNFRSPLFREEITVCQDYDLWSEYVWRAETMNMESVLLEYRRHGAQLTTAGVARLRSERSEVWRRLLPLLGLEMSGVMEEAHRVLSVSESAATLGQLTVAASWADQLWEANSQKRRVVREVWAEEIRHCWTQACFHASAQCKGVWGLYRKSRWRYRLDSHVGWRAILHLYLRRLRKERRGG